MHCRDVDKISSFRRKPNFRVVDPHSKTSAPKSLIDAPTHDAPSFHSPWFEFSGIQCCLTTLQLALLLSEWVSHLVRSFMVDQTVESATHLFWSAYSLIQRTLVGTNQPSYMCLVTFWWQGFVQSKRTWTQHWKQLYQSVADWPQIALKFSFLGKSPSLFSLNAPYWFSWRNFLKHLSIEWHS